MDVSNECFDFLNLGNGNVRIEILPLNLISSIVP